MTDNSTLNIIIAIVFMIIIGAIRHNSGMG